MAITTNGSARIFHNAYHYRTAPYGEIRTSSIHRGTDYGTVGKALPQYPPLDGAIVRQVVNAERNGDARGCRVRLEWPVLNLGMILQHLVEGSVTVKVGQTLTKGSSVGLTGMTGKYTNGSKVSTGVHAHVEVYYIDQSPSAPSNLATFDFETLDFAQIEKRQQKEDNMTEAQVRAIVAEILVGDDIPSDWAKTTGEWDAATKSGVVDGTKPTGYATREQVAAMVLRAVSR